MSTAQRLLDREFTQEICYELLPDWKGVDVKISQLSGGITNKLYRVQSEKGDYTVRMPAFAAQMVMARRASSRLRALSIWKPCSGHPCWSFRTTAA